MENRLTKFILLLAFLVTTSVSAAESAPPKQVLFKNVNVFNGTENKLYKNHQVLVEGNLIKAISSGEIETNSGATVIDGGGRTLTPGFIESHAHFVLMGPSVPAMEATKTWEDFGIHASKMAEMYLMQGFTTVRDAGGANGGIRRAIDSGLIVGPRHYPSGAFIGTRGGHADFANYTSPPDADTNVSRLNISQQANGPDEVRKYARNNFRMGATQLKFMQSGGIVSAFDPFQLLAGSQAEIEAAVEVANEYGSYVMVHAYRKEAAMTALKAGVKSIEHNLGFDKEVADLMKKKGAYTTTNLTSFDDSILEIPPVRDVPASLAKALAAKEMFKNYLSNMRKYPVKRGFNTDCIDTVERCNIQIAYEKHLHEKFFSAFEGLVSMTSVGGEIVALSGDFYNPYREGKLGVIEKGAYADLLLLDGNPLEDFSVTGASDKWLDAAPRPASPETIRIIMKDGKFYKNTLN